jgi:hypothetical protein
MAALLALAVVAAPVTALAVIVTLIAALMTALAIKRMDMMAYRGAQRA